jgi:hypothetical protein
MRPRFAAIALIVLAGASTGALAFTSAASSRAPDPHKQVRLSSTDALSVVRAIEPARQFSVSGPFEGKGQRYFAVTAQKVSADVDANDGKIRTMTWADTFPSGSGVAIAAEGATERAGAFLSKHGFSVPAMTGKVTLVPHGSFNEFLVEWQSRVNGALVPDYRSVSVNPETGEVFGYSDFSRAYSAPPNAEISSADAQAIAATMMGPGWTADSSDLLVTFDDAGVQQLTWAIAVSNAGIAFAVVDVDGLTGQATVVARG